MGINSKIAVAAIFSLAIAGCTIGDTGTIPPTPKDTSQNPPANQDTTTATKPSTDGSSPGSTPEVVPTVGSVFAPKNPGLTEPTKPEVRVKEIRQGRNDPFGEIVISPRSIPSLNPKPVPIPPPLPVEQIRTPSTQQTRGGNQNTPPQLRQPIQLGTPRQPQGTAQGRPNVRTGNTIASLPKPKPPVAPVLPKVIPQVVTPKKLEPVLPEPPKPETAEAVYVSGVVLIGKQPKAIIKVPGERTSRHVQAGQRLADGVLVKRIEMNGGSDPIVVFEQYGIEVAKAVGAKPKTDPSKTASVGNSIAMNSPL